MKKVCMALVAPVDAGKTTLSESLLFETGVIKRIGRVDNKDAFLDTKDVERERGITVYSKNARIPLSNKELILIDTPGHVDFSAETERALCAVDTAILLVNASTGVQAHTKTLWSLLKYYDIPTFIYVNKTDMTDYSKEVLLKGIKSNLSSNAVDFSLEDEMIYEEIATNDEMLTEKFLSEGNLTDEDVKGAIARREVYPVYFGSALKMVGIENLLEGLNRFLPDSKFEGKENDEFSARVYKITRDANGKRLTFMKILSGKLSVKEMLGEEKVNEIRIYSGEKYESVKEVFSGDICAIPGLNDSDNKTVYGKEGKVYTDILTPALSYSVYFKEISDKTRTNEILKELEEEDPTLKVEFNEHTREFNVSLMGEIQTEILKRTLKDRYNVTAVFGDGRILYKETVDGSVIGVGHFEPLRHYAEAQIRIEPLERGNGIEVESELSEDLLDINWQKQILTVLCEREHKGVLLGMPLTDVKLTLVAGRAHVKHTEGGDFRQATLRGVRQGLMKLRATGNTRILEPYYDYTLEIPESMVGRAMTDINAMNGTAVISETVSDKGITVLTGRAPVSTMKGYVKEVVSYSRGEGKLSLVLSGYDLCHNEEEVLSNSHYDPEGDVRNPSSSVFCEHGAGTVVSWDDVDSMKHVEYVPEMGQLNFSYDGSYKEANRLRMERERKGEEAEFISAEEVDAILRAGTRGGESERKGAYKGMSAAMRERNRTKTSQSIKETVYVGTKKKDKYLLVDGYNVIHAWTELSKIAENSLDAAVAALNDVLSNFAAVTGVNLIVVYDAYKVIGHSTEEKPFNNITVVFTKEAQTADQYIERYAHENAKNKDITVATSDGLEQIIVRGENCGILSSRELEEEVKRATEDFNRRFNVE